MWPKKAPVHTSCDCGGAISTHGNSLLLFLSSSSSWQTDMQRLILQSESKSEVGTVEKHHRYTHDVMDGDGGGEN